MNTKNSVFSNMVWRFAERCGAQLITFVVSIVLARLLAPEDYGKIALITVFTTILQVFVDSGLGTALIQKKDSDDLDFSSVFYFNFIVLENAIAALNLPKGGEVITTPFTFASTTHAIVRNGLIPVFCDIKEDDYTIDTQKLENLITDNTVAIVPVHVYGNICDVEEIDRISKKYGLKVIYDAAHAFAVKYKGESSACFGDASMFSFHATKVFNTIEGGCVCFKDDSWIQLLNDMKNFGIHGPESVQFVGANAKMNEFQAAMGICNLKHLNEEIEKRKHVVEHYRSRLESVEGIKLSIIQKDVESNYAYFPVVFDGYKYTRNEIFEKLAEVGIGARKYFYPLTNSFECYRNYPTAGAEKTPVAQHIALRVLTLPLYADLSLKDVDRICDIILNCKY